MKNALAMVRYKVYRSTEENKEKYGQAYWYKSNQQRLSQIGENHGTLWVVTSLKDQKTGKRIYSLAYRLQNCSPLKLEDPTKDKFGKYGVKSDFRDADHFGMNRMNEVLMQLHFHPHHPLKDASKIGYSLQTIRELAPEDVSLLNKYTDELKFGKKIFISYSSKDRQIATRLRNELINRGHEVWIDYESIQSGAIWKKRLEEALDKSAIMIALISPNAAASNWVRKETVFAAESRNKPLGFSTVIPLVTDMDAWKTFDHLHPFQYVDMHDGLSEQVLKRLMEDIKLFEERPQLV